ncbi:conserved hypothetical protein [Vibrio campbellii HY01]|nr:conserved hypothetical protein [Vibrio campbellii HY01]
MEKAMACRSCKEHWFWKKIGRCQRCMDQLTVLSVLCWIVWWFAFKDDPQSIESIALILPIAFNGLLFYPFGCARDLRGSVVATNKVRMIIAQTTDRKKPQDQYRSWGSLRFF